MLTREELIDAHKARAARLETDIENLQAELDQEEKSLAPMLGLSVTAYRKQRKQERDAAKPKPEPKPEKQPKEEPPPAA